MSRKVNFTKAVIEAAKAPAEGMRLVLIDAKTSGLQCRVTPNGVKTFSVFRRVKGGQPERVTLGRFPDMSVEQARTEAAQINAAIAKGQSTAEVKRANKEEPTFSELFEEYLEKHAKPKKRSWFRDEANYKLYLEKPLGRKRLSEINNQHIGKIHAEIMRQARKTKNKKETKYKSGATANRILGLASTVFNWGMLPRVGLCSHNPAKGIEKEKERSRERFLQFDELPRFFKSLEAEANPTIRDYIFLSLLTGARRTDVLSMRWDQISLERKEWRIPRTKNDEPQTIPLTKEVIDILKDRKSDQEKASKKNKKPAPEHVLPGPGRAGHLAEPRKGWERILKRAKITDLRIHDLRRTLGSWQAKSGASLAIIGKSLGHKTVQATQIYSRLDLDPVRKSVETATGAILKAAGVKKSAEVKHLNKGKKR